MQKIMAENKLLIPALRKAAEDQATFLKAPPKHMQAFVDPFKSGQFRTSFYHWNGLEALRLQAEQMKAAMNREKTAREAMLEANRASNAVVKYGNCRQAVTWKPRVVGAGDALLDPSGFPIRGGPASALAAAAAMAERQDDGRRPPRSAPAAAGSTTPRTPSAPAC